MGFLRFIAALTWTLSAFASGNDWLIVPGQRAGPVTASTTRSDLVRMFGRSNVKEGEVGVGDAIMPGTIVFPAKPGISFEVEWVDAKAETKIYSLHFCPVGSVHHCSWHTRQGVSKGTTLKTLERLNGHGFVLYGFGWDFEGTVISWRGGRMNKLTEGCLGIQLLPAGGARVPREAEGAHGISSSNAAIQALNPVVNLMSLRFQCSR